MKMEKISKNNSSFLESEKYQELTDDDEEIRIARENLEKIKSLNEYDQIQFCHNLDPESAKQFFNLLNDNNNKTLLGKKIKKPKSEAIIFNSKKPLWIDEVKKTCMQIMPKIDINEFENSKNILSQEEMDEHLCDPEEYPYYQTIKKLLYAFGDCYKNNPRTIIFMHDFVKKWLILILRIISECEFKKIMDHLYSCEYLKFFNYKKLKLRNCIKGDNENENNKNRFLDSDSKLKKNENDESLSIADDEDVELSLKSEDKNPLVNLNLDLNLDIEEMNNINDENFNFKIHNENPTLNLILDENELALNSEVVSVEGNSTKKKNEAENNLIKNIFDVQNEFYEENLEFQDLRTQKMNEAEYLEYINCRIQGFLTRGKKLFLNYLQNIILSSNIFKTTNKIVKDYSCENIHNPRNKNTNKNTSSNMNYNITNINDEELIENQKVENNFIGNSYHQYDKNINNSYIDNLYNVPYELKDQGNLELICFILKELMNKIVKNAIKNKNPEKRLLELKYPLDVEDIENFSSEELDKLEQFLSDYSVSIYLMKDFKKKKFCKLNNKNVKIKKVKSSFYVLIKKYIFLETNSEADYFRKNRKSMEEKIAKNFKNLYSEYNKQCFNSKRISLINSRNKNKTKINKNNKKSDLIILEEDRILQKEIEKKYLLDYFNIQHYYEFYLLKDVLKEVDDINYSINFSKLKKINKKYFTKKFELWINMGEFERSFYKNEYKIILGVKDKENELF